MANIKLLNQETINQIAAGEVIDRPSSIVKELMENAIDAGSTAITVEIKDGGVSFIRITDNGCGIEKDDINMAFLRHSTSKIESAKDLLTIASLGFRGEALSSIAAVSQVELITKTKSSLTGIRYVMEGGEEKTLEDIGAPDGTTFIIRNLFYNTPARRKFLKSPTTEAGYISDIIEKIALSHPEISIRFINGSQSKIHTSGNGKLKDVIYNIYGRDIAANLIEVDYKNDTMHIKGYIGKPVISRGNRNFENYFINGRFIKNAMIYRGIEEAYKPYMMQHKYPFTALHIDIDKVLCDVNVHPSKMEIRFRNQDEIYGFLYKSLADALTEKELIPDVVLSMPKLVEENLTINKVSEPQITKHIEPFEQKRMEEFKKQIDKTEQSEVLKEASHSYETKQINMFEDKLLSKEALPMHRIIGQLFDTYWLIEYNNGLYIIDQHAAHEKVLFERTMNSLKEKDVTSQKIIPPIILSLTLKEENLLNEHMNLFTEIGYEIEHFGGNEYAVRAVPDNLFSISKKELLMNMIDTLAEEVSGINKNELILEKIASMSCKAAIKGNMSMSYAEANELIKELLSLDNPYNCPHGRPTIISMTKYELEKKFKRIV